MQVGHNKVLWSSPWNLRGSWVKSISFCRERTRSSSLTGMITEQKTGEWMAWKLFMLSSLWHSPTPLPTNTLTHLLIWSYTFRLIRSTRSGTLNSLTNSPTYSPNYTPPTHKLTHLLILSYTRPLIHPSHCHAPLIHTQTHPLTHMITHSPTHSFSTPSHVTLTHSLVLRPHSHVTLTQFVLRAQPCYIHTAVRSLLSHITLTVIRSSHSATLHSRTYPTHCFHHSITTEHSLSLTHTNGPPDGDEQWMTFKLISTSQHCITKGFRTCELACKKYQCWIRKKEHTVKLWNNTDFKLPHNWIPKHINDFRFRQVSA